MSVFAFSRKVIGQFRVRRIVKFGITDASDENANTLNRSGTIMLPMKAVVTGASACVLVPE